MRVPSNEGSPTNVGKSSNEEPPCAERSTAAAGRTSSSSPGFSSVAGPSPGQACVPARAISSDDHGIPETSRSTSSSSAAASDTGRNRAARPTLKAKYVPPMDLEKIVEYAKASGNKALQEKLAWNLRFVKDISVYEEIIGPSALEPQESMISTSQPISLKSCHRARSH